MSLLGHVVHKPLHALLQTVTSLGRALEKVKIIVLSELVALLVSDLPLQVAFVANKYYFELIMPSIFQVLQP